MQKVLAASALLLGLAVPAFAQSQGDADVLNNEGVRSPAEAVNGASILPSTGGESILPSREGGVDQSTTQSVSPDVSVPNTTLPNVSQPGTGIDGGIAPPTSGGTPDTLGNTALPGSTVNGPASGGNSAY